MGGASLGNIHAPSLPGGVDPTESISASVYPVFVHCFGRKRQKIGRMFWREGVLAPVWLDLHGLRAKNRSV